MMPILKTLKNSLMLSALSGVLLTSPLFAQDGGAYPPKSMKGLYELDLFTQVVSRRVVEEVGPGEDFKADAASTRLLARLRIKPVKPLEVYVQGGAANLDVQDFNGYRGEFGFAYGGGLNLTLYEDPGIDRFRLILSGDALTFTTSDKVVTSIQSERNILVNEEITWVEYSAAGIGAWRVQNMEPYVGVRFSWLDSTDNIKDSRVGKIDLQEDSNIGILAGVDVFLDRAEKFAFNLEAALIDQASLKIGVKLWY